MPFPFDPHLLAAPSWGTDACPATLLAAAKALGPLGLPPGFVTILFALDGQHPHDAKMLLADTAAARSLLSLLLRSLSKAAVALRLPPDRRPEAFSLPAVSGLLRFLARCSIVPVLVQHLQSLDGPALLRLLRSVTCTLERLLLERPAGQDPQQDLQDQAAAAALVHQLAVAAVERQQRAEAEAAVLPLSALLPEVAALVNAACGAESVRDSEEPLRLLFRSWAPLLQPRILAPSCPESEPGPPLPDKFVAASHALRALPTLAEAAQKLQHLAPHLAAAVLVIAEAAITACMMDMQGSAQLDSAALAVDQAGAPAAAAAAGTLQGAVCRCAHWAASNVARFQSLSPHVDDPVLALVELATRAFQAAVCLHVHVPGDLLDRRAVQPSSRHGKGAPPSCSGYFRAGDSSVRHA